MRSNMRDRHIHDSANKTQLMNMTTKNNHVIYELWMGIVRLSGFDSFTLLTFTTLFMVLNLPNNSCFKVFSCLTHMHHASEIQIVLLFFQIGKNIFL